MLIYWNDKVYKVIQIVIHNDLEKLLWNNYKAKLEWIEVLYKVNDNIYQVIKIVLPIDKIKDIKNLIGSY